VPPCRRLASRPRPNSAPGFRPSHGSLGTQSWESGSQSRGQRQRLDRTPLSRQPRGVTPGPDFKLLSFQTKTMKKRTICCTVQAAAMISI
jgi:hypothetical protein